MRGINKVALIACGTSWHAALVGKFLIERFAGLPVEVDYGSEYRYRDFIVDRNTLVVIITQSGETADRAHSANRARRARAVCRSMWSAAWPTQSEALHTPGPQSRARPCPRRNSSPELLSLYLGQMKHIVGSASRAISTPYDCQPDCAGPKSRGNVRDRPPASPGVAFRSGRASIPIGSREPEAEGNFIIHEMHPRRDETLPHALIEATSLGALHQMITCSRKCLAIFKRSRREAAQ